MAAPVEEGSARENLDSFRRCLGEFATGVAVITTRFDGVEYGLTSNSFASVSLKPPLVLWSIRRESTSFDAFAACSHFAVNVLSADQMDLSQRFARSRPDKFDGIALASAPEEMPLFHGVSASFECVRTSAIDGGDHLILIGMVEKFRRYDRQPLVFSKGRYAIAAEHPATRLPAVPPPEGGHGGAEEELLPLLMARAYSAVAVRLEKARVASGLGLTLMQARLLKAVHSHPDRTLEQLLPELFLEFNASQNTLGTLTTLGLLSRDGSGRVHLTAEGTDYIERIVEHTRASEKVLFANASPEDLAAARRVLSDVISTCSVPASH